MNVLKYLQEKIMIQEKILNDKEINVLNLVKLGYYNNEIGKNLDISPASVKLILQSAMHKLGVQNRTAAMYTAFKKGYID